MLFSCYRLSTTNWRNNYWFSTHATSAKTYMLSWIPEMAFESSSPSHCDASLLLPFPPFILKMEGPDCRSCQHGCKAKRCSSLATGLSTTGETTIDFQRMQQVRKHTCWSWISEMACESSSPSHCDASLLLPFPPFILKMEGPDCRSCQHGCKAKRCSSLATGLSTTNWRNNYWFSTHATSANTYMLILNIRNGLRVIVSLPLWCILAFALSTLHIKDGRSRLQILSAWVQSKKMLFSCYMLSTTNWRNNHWFQRMQQVRTHTCWSWISEMACESSSPSHCDASLLLPFPPFILKMEGPDCRSCQHGCKAKRCSSLATCFPPPIGETTIDFNACNKCEHIHVDLEYPKWPASHHLPPIVMHLCFCPFHPSYWRWKVQTADPVSMGAKQKDALLLLQAFHQQLKTSLLFQLLWIQTKDSGGDGILALVCNS